MRSFEQPQTPPPAARPGFLSLPERTSKPRRVGVSHVLDNGMSLREAENRLAAASSSIDIWKFGWGTAYVDPAVEAKTRLLKEHDVLPCTGGTLLEVAWRDGAASRLMEWAMTVGFTCMEVSCGSIPISRDVKSLMIETVAEHFTVLAEVGVKDPSAEVRAEHWAREAAADKEAGAHWVVTEGRESGTVGLFDAGGEVRPAIVDAVVEAVGLGTVLFEAPRREQQAWLINRFGANVNLGNINAAEALAVECLRLGLRSDTISGTIDP
jgi:phosphosulfolactate synthase